MRTISKKDIPGYRGKVEDGILRSAENASIKAGTELSDAFKIRRVVSDGVHIGDHHTRWVSTAPDEDGIVYACMKGHVSSAINVRV